MRVKILRPVAEYLHIERDVIFEGRTDHGEWMELEDCDGRDHYEKELSSFVVNLSLRHCDSHDIRPDPFDLRLESAVSILHR